MDGSSDGDAVRRAYLRALKLHKPERDPEGFQRVREAYDLLRGAMAFSAIDLEAAARARADAPEPAVAPSQPGPPDPPARDERDDAASSTAGETKAARTQRRRRRRWSHGARLRRAIARP